jgi:hypothetical protein
MKRSVIEVSSQATTAVSVPPSSITLRSMRGYKPKPLAAIYKSKRSQVGWFLEPTRSVFALRKRSFNAQLAVFGVLK